MSITYDISVAEAMATSYPPTSDSTYIDNEDGIKAKFYEFDFPID